MCTVLLALGRRVTDETETQMKHLLTAIACCLAVAGSAQTPYNPDSDGDNSITVEDLMSTLSFFGGPFFVDYSMIQVCDAVEMGIQGVDTCYVEEGKSGKV